MFRWALEHFWRFTGSLRFKLSFYTGVVAFLTIVAFAAHSIVSQERHLIEARIQGALKDSEVIKAAVWNGMMTNNRELISQIVETIGIEEGFEEINIYDTEGVLHYSSRDDAASILGKAVEGSETGSLLKDLEKDRSLRYKLKEGTNVVTVVNPLLNTETCSTAECHAHPKDILVLGALEVKLQLKGLRRALKSAVRDITFFAFILFLLISTIIGVAVIMLVSHPVERLRAKAERISRGDYPDPDKDATGLDSVSVLSRSLDEMSRQISERESELDQSRKMYKELFDNVPCYLTVVDKSFRIAFYNNMFGEDFGRQWGEKCFRAYKGRSEKCENCPVDKTFADGESHYSEEIWHRDGKDQHIVVRTSPIWDERGDIVEVMEMCTNVTELKVLENQLAILGETIAGTSHAVKNILSGLEGGVYVVDSGLRAGNKERILTGWEMVKKNVEKVSELVKDVLYASRERTPEYKECDPGKILGDIYELYEEKTRAQGIDLVKDFPPEIGVALLDPKGIHEVLSNLISNAVTASLEDTNGDSHHITMSGKLDDGWLIIEVADNGAGMSDEVQQNLFKKFYSTKGSKGTGLGMLITRKIVEENGGTISFDSRLGEGTRFVVRLPFRQVIPQAPSQTNPKAT